MATNNAEKDDSYDDEIVMLLHQVGQRLLRSEHERKEFKHMLADLEDKADQGERAFLTVQDRLHKTESAISKRQKYLEKVQKEQAERIEKAATMADKIEEAIAQHSKINRRLDKAAQDKVRMLRKLDRIEEAVTETQEALQSKAMVLLTDHKMANENHSLQATANGKTNGQDNAPWWKQHAPVRTAAIAAMVLLGVSGGWLVNKIQPNSPFGAGQEQSEEIAYNTYEQPSFSTLSDYEKPEYPEENTEIIENILTEVTEVPVKAQETRAQPPKPKPKQDISPIEMDDAQLLASLNENPDALAAQLNKISPAGGAIPPEDFSKTAPKPETKIKKASFSPKKVKEVTTTDFINGQKNSRPLREYIPRDSSLPAVIKEVENKAFEGMPEAQHDLAAIYTAGHGGVDVDFAKAAIWFRESAIQGIANARYNLGVLYHQGLGVTEDINIAVNWYRAAAEAGHPEAQYNLGIAYIEGIGTKYDPKKASYYFEKAANEGILEAAYNLGLIYENGLTGESKPDTALYWYKQAADMGSPEAKIAMDQLAKTLGLFPEEVDRLYSKTKEDKKAAAPQAIAPKKEQRSASADNNNVEYIEAGPLVPMQATAAPTTTTYETQKTDSNSYAVIAQIQEQLIRVGLYPGPADGINDNLTEDAIRAYQANYDLQQSGSPSEALLVHMMTSELGSSNEYGSRPE